VRLRRPEIIVKQEMNITSGLDEFCSVKASDGTGPDDSISYFHGLLLLVAYKSRAYTETSDKGQERATSKIGKIFSGFAPVYNGKAGKLL